MKTNQLAQLLNTTPVKITEKVRSTNALTAIMAMALLEMPQDDARPYLAQAMANFAKVETKANEKRAKARENKAKRED